MPLALTTFQGRDVRYQLRGHRAYRAHWRHTDPADHWRKAYAWMARQMARRGLPTLSHPPIWAWPRDRSFGGPPTIGTAYALLSEAELENGVWIIDLSVPTCRCLRSSYRIWNAIIDSFFDGIPVGEPPYGLMDAPLYRSPAPVEPDDHQFCLPYIHTSWVRGIRPMPYRTGMMYCADWNKRI